MYVSKRVLSKLFFSKVCKFCFLNFIYNLTQADDRLVYVIIANFFQFHYDFGRGENPMFVDQRSSSSQAFFKSLNAQKIDKVLQFAFFFFLNQYV